MSLLIACIFAFTFPQRKKPHGSQLDLKPKVGRSSWGTRCFDFWSSYQMKPWSQVTASPTRYSSAMFVKARDKREKVVVLRNSKKIIRYMAYNFVGPFGCLT